MKDDEFVEWVHSIAPEARDAAIAHCDKALSCFESNGHPFDHPWCWAAFSLLGNAPKLAELPMAAAPGFSWGLWFRQIWQRLMPLPR